MPAGLSVLPDLDPDHFVFEQWVIDALKTDPKYGITSTHFPVPTVASRSIAFSITTTQSVRSMPCICFRR